MFHSYVSFPFRPHVHCSSQATSSPRACRPRRHCPTERWGGGVTPVISYIAMEKWANFTVLVGSFNPSEKYEFVSWDDEIPNIWKKTCSKPPTSSSSLFYAYKNTPIKNLVYLNEPRGKLVLIVVFPIYGSTSLRIVSGSKIGWIWTHEDRINISEAGVLIRLKHTLW